MATAGTDEYPVIRELYKDLVDNIHLSGTCVLSRLQQDDTITQEEKEHVQSQTTTAEQTRELLAILFERKDRRFSPYENFKKALAKDHGFLISKLEDTERRLHEEDEPDGLPPMKSCLRCRLRSHLNVRAMKDELVHHHILDFSQCSHLDKLSQHHQVDYVLDHLLFLNAKEEFTDLHGRFCKSIKRSNPSIHSMVMNLDLDDYVICRCSRPPSYSEPSIGMDYSPTTRLRGTQCGYGVESPDNVLDIRHHGNLPGLLTSPATQTNTCTPNLPDLGCKYSSSANSGTKPKVNTNNDVRDTGSQGQGSTCSRKRKISLHKCYEFNVLQKSWATAWKLWQSGESPVNLSKTGPATVKRHVIELAQTLDKRDIDSFALYEEILSYMNSMSGQVTHEEFISRLDRIAEGSKLEPWHTVRTKAVLSNYVLLRGGDNCFEVAQQLLHEAQTVAELYEPGLSSGILFMYEAFYEVSLSSISSQMVERQDRRNKAISFLHQASEDVKKDHDPDTLDLSFILTYFSLLIALIFINVDVSTWIFDTSVPSKENQIRAHDLLSGFESHHWTKSPSLQRVLFFIGKSDEMRIQNNGERSMFYLKQAEKLAKKCSPSLIQNYIRQCRSHLESRSILNKQLQEDHEGGSKLMKFLKKIFKKD